MATFTTPSPSEGSMKSQSQSPAFRQKSAYPWRVTRFSPCLPRNPLLKDCPTFKLPTPIANPLFQGSSSALQTDVQFALRPERVETLILSFSFWKNGIPSGPTEEQLPEVLRLFPTLKSIGYFHPYMVITVDELPEKPWPAFLGDLPLWLNTPLEEQPMPYFGHVINPHQTAFVKGDIIHYVAPSEATIWEIFKLLDKHEANIQHLHWDGCMFIAVGSQEPQEGCKERVPGRINNHCISYIWTESTLVEHAIRLKVPAANFIDDTNYGRDQLRPGVLLSSVHNDMQQELGTTSGICLQSPTTDKKYITVAAHGFTGGVGDFVYHPKVSFTNGQPDGRNHIATIERVFGDTDIALAELKPGFQYARESFSESSQDRVQPFRGFADPYSLRFGDVVHMNTPVNGVCNGKLLGWKFTRIDATDDHPSEAAHMQVCLFSYFGNGSDIFFEGCRGGVIWDDNFDLLGQFHFQEKDGLQRTLSPAFNVLDKSGYRLSSI